MKPQTALILNAFALYAIAGVLIAAFAMQLALGELPCPLCLLQRILFCALAVGPILNLRHGPRASHYALTMLAALIGAAVSVRQILLHILPGDPGYGSAILGYHYYSWVFLLFVLALALAAVMLLFDDLFRDRASEPSRSRFASVAIWLVMVLTIANVLSTFAICGPNECPDNPVRYELLRR